MRAAPAPSVPWNASEQPRGKRRGQLNLDARETFVTAVKDEGRELSIEAGAPSHRATCQTWGRYTQGESRVGEARRGKEEGVREGRRLG